MAKACNICCDAFNLTTRKKTICPFCDAKCCMACNKKYLIESIQDPHCMNCMKAWPLEIFKNMVPFTFIQKDYKVHRETVLFERELAMLPATQVYADNIVLIKNLCKKRAELLEERRKIDEMIGDLNDEINIRQNPEFKIKTEKKVYIRSCPGDGCRGFLDTEWNCSLCQTMVCSKCYEIKHDEHVCDEAILKNVKAIKNSTKPCPTCSIPTFKINGCNQMWCTSCHTTWCWASGLVEKGVVHNPHYYEYLRKQSVDGEIPRNIGDNCNDNFLVTSRALVVHLCEIDMDQECFDQQLTIHRNILHLVYFMGKYRTVNVEDMNRDLRVKYIMNDITEENFKMMLQKQEKTRLRKAAIWEILNTFYIVIIDIFNRAMLCNKVAAFEKTVKEMVSIKDYSNNLMRKVKTIYKCKVPIIQAESYDINME